MRLRRNPDVPAQPLRLDGDELNLARVLVERPGRVVQLEANQLVIDNLPEAPSSWRSSPPAAGQEHQAHGPVREQRHLLHAMRGRRLPPHHLLPGPARRDGQLHRHAARQQGPLPGAAVQRQPGRAGRPGRRPPLRQVGRPVPQAQLPVRAGGRQLVAASSASTRATAASTCCRSTCAPATSTRPSTR